MDRTDDAIKRVDYGRTNYCVEDCSRGSITLDHLTNMNNLGKLTIAQHPNDPENTQKSIDKLSALYRHFLL